MSVRSSFILHEKSSCAFPIIYRRDGLCYKRCYERRTPSEFQNTKEQYITPAPFSFISNMPEQNRHAVEAPISGV